MRDLLIFVLALGFTVAAIRRPIYGILGWTWVSFMNPHRMAWGFMYSFPIGQMIVFGIFLGLLFSRDRKSLPLTPATWTMLLFVGWMLITFFMALYPDKSTDMLSRVMKIQLLTLVTLALLHSRQHIRWVLWMAAGSLAFFGVKGGLFTLLGGGEFRVWGPPESFISDNNHVALALVMAIPLLYFIYGDVEKKWARLLALGAMGLTALAVIGTHSRGGFLAAGAMAAVLWWRSDRKVLVGMALILVAAVVAALMPPEWWARMETIASYEQDKSAMGRINAWSMAWNLALDRFTGGGFWVFEQVLFDRYSMNPADGVRAAHSIYFQVLGEHGFVGLFLFCGIWFFVWRDIVWIRRNTRDRAELAWAHRLASMIQVSLVGYLVGGAFLSLTYFDLPYLLAVLVIATRRLVRETLNATEETSSELAANLSPSRAEGVP